MPLLACIAIFHCRLWLQSWRYINGYLERAQMQSTSTWSANFVCPRDGSLVSSPPNINCCPAGSRFRPSCQTLLSPQCKSMQPIERISNVSWFFRSVYQDALSRCQLFSNGSLMTLLLQEALETLPCCCGFRVFATLVLQVNCAESVSYPLIFLSIPWSIEQKSWHRICFRHDRDFFV